MKLVVCASLAACVASVLGFAPARADIILATKGPYRFSITEPVPVGTVENLIAMTLKITNTSGSPSLNAYAIGGSIGGAGELHQEQFMMPHPPFEQLTTPTLVSSGGSHVDSHFLRPAFLTITPQSEPLVDDNTSQEPGQFDGITGFSGPIIANVALGTGENPPPATVELAYIVIRNNHTGYGFDYDFCISGGGAVEGCFLFEGRYEPTVDDFPPEAMDATLAGKIPQLVEHTFTATDDDTLPGELNWSGFQFLYEGGDAANGKQDPAAVGPSFDVDTQRFVWPSTAHRKPGTYTASATVSEPDFPDKQDIATLTIHLVIPEPNGLTLGVFSLFAVVLWPRQSKFDNFSQDSVCEA